VHREGELIGVEHSVAVEVRELPDLAKDRVWQLGLDEFGLGRRSGDLAVDWVEVLHTTANHRPL